MKPSDKDNSVIIIGAGPAGLTAAYLLSKRGVPVTVVESDPVYVGGIARTAKYNGYHFDIGGHRFFSKSKQVEDLWTEILPDDMLVRPRSSRIFYRGKFFSYPLKPAEAFFKLGLAQSILCVLSYAKAKAFPVRSPRNVEEWVSNQFGSRLFNIFFKTYTEKVWGMSCKEISADWAAQRIKGLSLGTAFTSALKKLVTPAGRGKVVKSLIESFRYPRKGPGMLWEACARKVKEQGGTLLMGRRVSRCHYDSKTGAWSVTHDGTDGRPETIVGRHVISSMPLRELVTAVSPEPSETARKAARALKYRDFLTVVLIVKDSDAFPDNWIYIHDPSVKVGRIQNFKAWSPEMVPFPTMACYGLEYFCFESDDFWRAPDHELIALAKREISQIGLARVEDIVDGCIVRQVKAYPVYDDHYEKNVATIREELETKYPTLHFVGRNGMHKYNNQDHSMMTAMLTADNIIAGERRYDVWRVNEDAEYHETVSESGSSAASGLRMTPKRISVER